MNDRFVEQIVSQVMARLGGSAPARPAAEDPHASRAARAAARPVVLDEPVVTAETLEQRMNGHLQLAVGPRTVLTPSALDYLRTEGIAWTRGPVEKGTKSGNSAGATWAAIVSRTTPAVERLLSDIDSTGRQWRRELVGTAEEAVERAVSCICRGEAAGCVVLADDPEVVTCRANRNVSVRAAVATELAHVAAALRSLGANIICVDPGALSYFELRNMLRAFAAAGPPRAPAGWSES